MAPRKRTLTTLTAATALLGGPVALSGVVTAVSSVATAATASAAAAAGAPLVHGSVVAARGLIRSAAGTSVAAGLSASLFASGPAGVKGPDDITTLGGDIFVAYQNGVGPIGQPAGAVTSSTLVEYHPDGYVVASWSLTGKIDGLTADPANARLVATVNEDGNSSLYTIHPAAPAGAQVFHLSYSPPTLTWGGGTDAPRIFNGALYISASAPSFTPPNPGGVPALISVTLDETAGTAAWQPAFDAPANDPTQIATDPDSNNVVPAVSPLYGGDFVLDSQGDGQLYFIAHPGPGATATALQLQGTQVDDIEFATATTGTLYVVDNAGNHVVALTSSSFPPGTAFVAVPSDSSVPSFVGTVDLGTGIITPVVTGITNPHGMLFVPGPPAPGPYGYRLTAADGGTFNFGDSTQLGSLGSTPLNKPIVGSTSTSDRLGQYLVASDGGVFAFGDAVFYGSLGASPGPSPVAGIATTAGGYWLAAANGTVTAFGAAPSLGSLTAPSGPVVGIAASPDGLGYWLTTSTGAVYGFGDAKAVGGISDQKLNGPIVGIAATPDGFGYWLVASDGGVFAFGDAGFYGSTGGLKLNKPVVSIRPTRSGQGYQLVASDGGVFAFGDAGFYGSTGSLKLNKPVVASSS